jgi:hypothetical protein
MNCSHFHTDEEEDEGYQKGDIVNRSEIGNEIGKLWVQGELERMGSGKDEPQSACYQDSSWDQYAYRDKYCRYPGIGFESSEVQECENPPNSNYNHKFIQFIIR